MDVTVGFLPLYLKCIFRLIFSSGKSIQLEWKFHKIL